MKNVDMGLGLQETPPEEYQTLVLLCLEQEQQHKLQQSLFAPYSSSLIILHHNYPFAPQTIPGL